MADNILTELPPEKLQKVLDSLEKERQRRANGKLAAAEVKAVERCVVGPETNAIISNPSPAPPRAKPKPRKAKARSARLTPVPFFIYVTEAIGADPGSIAEGHFIVQDDKVFLSDASGIPSGEGHTILRDALWTAKTALRQRLTAQRGDGPNHRPIQYRATGWR
jgi:hypothetical protein